MAIYQTQELLNQISEILSDGYKYVEITELDADEEEDIPVSLNFSAIESSFSEIDYESVDSCKIPKDYDSDSDTFPVSGDDYVPISFTFKEVCTLKQSVDNALEYLKECSKDTSYSKETLDDIKASSVRMRNLQAKLAQFLKLFNPL